MVLSAEIIAEELAVGSIRSLQKLKKTNKKESENVSITISCYGYHMNKPLIRFQQKQNYPKQRKIEPAQINARTDFIVFGY